MLCWLLHHTCQLLAMAAYRANCRPVHLTTAACHCIRLSQQLATSSYNNLILCHWHSASGWPLHHTVPVAGHCIILWPLHHTLAIASYSGHCIIQCQLLAIASYNASCWPLRHTVPVAGHCVILCQLLAIASYCASCWPLHHTAPAIA